MIIQLKQICAILSGLVVASDFRLGQRMLVEREFSDNADWFKAVFEIGRRYKIQNPDAMRGSYGMMMYMIQVAPKTHCVIASPFVHFLSILYAVVGY